MIWLVIVLIIIGSVIADKAQKNAEMKTFLKDWNRRINMNTEDYLRETLRNHKR